MWFFATVTFAAASYLALATQATFAGGLTPAGVVLSAVLLVLETAGLLLACTFAFETVTCCAGRAGSARSGPERNSIIFGGTMGLIHRPVLDEVGRWDEWCTQDAEISLRILAAGYQGVYVHRSYGEGIMPLTFDAVLIGSTLTVLAGRPLTFRPFGGPVIDLPITLAVSGGLRAVSALRTLNGISVRRAVLAFANWLALSWTVGFACAKALVRRDGAFLRTAPCGRGHARRADRRRHRPAQPGRRQCHPLGLWGLRAAPSGPTDQGPLGNIGVLTGANPAAPATTSPSPGARTTITTPATTPTSAPGATTASTRPPGSSLPASTAPPGSTSATRPGQAPPTVPPPKFKDAGSAQQCGAAHIAHPDILPPTVGHRCWRQPARPAVELGALDRR